MQQWTTGLPDTEFYAAGTKGLEAVVKEVLDTPEVAIDTETTGLVNWKDIPLYFSLAWGHRRMTLNVSALPYFDEAFKDPSKRWIMANAKYDTHILANAGHNIAGSLVDVQVMHSLLYEDHPHNLKYMNFHLFGWKWADFQDTFGKISSTQSPQQMIERAERENFTLLCEYAANDAWGTWQSYLELKRQLQGAMTHSLFSGAPLRIKTLWDLFDTIETPYTKVLWKMERRGVLLNVPYLEQIKPAAEMEIENLNRQICKLAGRADFNPNSVAQMRDYFLEQLKLRPQKMTKGGKSGVKQASIDSTFLEYHAAEVPMAKLLLEHRSVSKLYGTFIVGIGERLDPNGRIHSTLNQDVARTGRLSSKDPNVQQIPKPENDKWNIRNAFIASPGMDMIVGDYEQLEMRLLAAASLEPKMVDVINKGWDIHMGNAAMMYGVDYDDVKAAKKVDKQVKEGNLPQSAMTPRVAQLLGYRSDAKQLGFALIYGQGARATAATLGCSIIEAEEKIETFEAAYPGALAFKKEAIAETEETGYAFTILGRRRNVQEIASANKGLRKRGERIAVNTQIQGSAADVVKLAQILIDASNLEYHFGCEPLLAVHDELAYESPKSTSAEALREIKDWMEHPFPHDLAVELGVDIKRGATWGQAK